MLRGEKRALRIVNAKRAHTYVAAKVALSIVSVEANLQSCEEQHWLCQCCPFSCLESSPGQFISFHD